MNRILGLEHRANGILGYQEEDGTYVAVLKYPIGVIKSTKMYYGDPYNWKSVDDGEFKWHCESEVDSVITEDDGLFEYKTFKLKSREMRFKYFFKVETEKGFYAYGEFGTMEWQETSEFSYHGFAFTWNYSSIGKFVSPPKWWTETNWYQIFPDRFNSSKKKMEPIGNDNHQIEGGDILGIIEKLDYIKDMGFNGVYLNPIFLASSAHKYDTVDYFQIDPDFGTMEDFDLLVKEIEKRGMKLMLDGVFNHCGVNHPFFQDVLKNRENSKYKDWFVIWDMENMKQPSEESRGEFIDEKTYGTFGNTPFMPRLDWSNPEVSDYVCSIVEFWTKKGIHAWRMDVADEVSFEMWRKVRVTTKKINPEIALLGEVWYDAIPFLNGDQFDTSMNYPFRNNLLDFLINKKINLKEYVFKTIENKYKYSNEINKGLFNLVGSHDTDRISVVANEDPIITRFAIAILMLSQGVISFYYGDEIDLNHDKGKLNRGTFEWDKPQGNTFEIITKLLKYRNDNVEHIQKGIQYDYVGDEKLIFIISNGDKIEFDFKEKKINIMKANGNVNTVVIKGEWNE